MVGVKGSKGLHLRHGAFIWLMWTSRLSLFVAVWVSAVFWTDVTRPGMLVHPVFELHREVRRPGRWCMSGPSALSVNSDLWTLEGGQRRVRVMESDWGSYRKHSVWHLTKAHTGVHYTLAHSTPMTLYEKLWHPPASCSPRNRKRRRNIWLVQKELAWVINLYCYEAQNWLISRPLESADHVLP